MNWTSLIVILILVFGFVGGLRSGVVVAFFSLLTLLIAIPCTGIFYGLVASFLSFLPGENWENFFGFLITMVIISIIFSLIFLIPRHFIKIAWSGGFLSSSIGGILSAINAAISIFLVVLLLRTFPISDWLNNYLAESSVISWIMTNLDIIRIFLPAFFNDNPLTV